MLAAWKLRIASFDSPGMNSIHLDTCYQSILKMAIMIVYFHEATAARVARDGRPKTKLIEFFQLCQQDDFAKNIISKRLRKKSTHKDGMRKH